MNSGQDDELKPLIGGDWISNILFTIFVIVLAICLFNIPSDPLFGDGLMSNKLDMAEILK